MICALCLEREADKRNTHYLSDSIIRTALNWEGSNGRERGFYFTAETGNPFLNFNFQRSTPIDAVEQAFGRSADEQEIEHAKERLYSVDNVFCTDCEALFTEIEDHFCSGILPLFRNNDLGQVHVVLVEEEALARIFFYLQIWRSSVCEEIFKLPPDVKETLRADILGFHQGRPPSRYPLSITYLETLGGAFQFTKNLVGHTNDRAPRLILFNDFVIQFFDSAAHIDYFDYFGLNSREEYFQMINFQADTFRVKILHDQDRLAFWDRVYRAEIVRGRRESYESQFIRSFEWLVGFVPPQMLVNRFIRTLAVNAQDDLLQFSSTGLGSAILRFIAGIYPKRYPINGR
jgi:hypothetical protein